MNDFHGVTFLRRITPRHARGGCYTDPPFGYVEFVIMRVLRTRTALSLRALTCPKVSYGIGVGDGLNPPPTWSPAKIARALKVLTGAVNPCKAKAIIRKFVTCVFAYVRLSMP